MGEMLEAGGANYSELKNLIVWVKDNGGMGAFYRSRHELIFAFKNGSAPDIKSFELGQHGRCRTNAWQYRGVNTLKTGRLDELALHPTVKPVAMIADAMKDVSSRGGLVLDLFGGSGSTLIAAHKTGRRARLCELDPVNCDRILRRWEIFAKDDAEPFACGLASRPRTENRVLGKPRDSDEVESKTMHIGLQTEVRFADGAAFSDEPPGRQGQARGRRSAAKRSRHPSSFIG